MFCLTSRVQEELPDKNIWIYTGYRYDRDLVPGGRRHISVTEKILGDTDVLVDGPFLLAEKDITLDFRGSRNQRLIDMRATGAQGCIVEYDAKGKATAWKGK